MRAYGTLGSLLFTSLGVYAASLRVLEATTLGEDPQTVNHLNGESFQQDALVTFNGGFSSCTRLFIPLHGSRRVPGYQYAAYYIEDATNASVRHPSLARRALTGDNKEWESFTFTDFNQTLDDGHDM